MKRAIKYVGKVTILFLFVVMMLLIVFSTKPIETAYAATVITTDLKFVSASVYWYQNQKTSSGVYGGTDPIPSIPYASLRSNGTLNYHNGKYYTDNSSLTAFYNGMSDNWRGYSNGETSGANWGKISINSESAEAGQYCADKVGNYGSQAFANLVGKIELSCGLKNGLNQITFKLQQGSHKVFWMKQDTATGVVDVIYDSTFPVITINGITNGYATNSNLKISVSDTYLDKITLDGKGIDNNSSVSRSSLSDGVHTVVAVDYAGNVSAQSFTVDNTAPTISKSITSNYTNNTFTVTTKDEHSTGLLYKTPTSTDWISVNNDTITINKTNGDGLYQFKGVDIVGLTSEVISITLDTIKPSLTGQSDGAYTNKPFTIKAVDTNFGELYYKRPNGEFAKAEGSSYAIVAGSANGIYEFYCLDKAENRFPESGSFKVNFDTVAPTMTGVTNGAFYKDKITVKWDESVLFNSSDAVTAKYTLSTTGAFPTSSVKAFVSGTTFNAEGNYRISFCDKAGNEKIYTFSIDKQAPTLILDGVNSKNFSKTSMKATWLKTVGGVGAQFMNSNDSITAKYAVSNSGTFPKVADKNYLSGSALAQEGNYLIVITDKAGNERSYQFTIDKTAPTLTLSGLVSGLSYNGSKSGFSANWVTTVGGLGLQRVNDNDVITVKYSRNSTTIFPTSANTAYTRNAVLGNEGYYLLQITDSAENTSEYSIVVDKTAPTVSRISEYLNYGFDFEATDLHNATILYKFNDGQQRSDRSGKVTITCDKANYGIWEFYAEDELGNRSEKQSIHLFYRSDFGNLENVKNGYKVPTWFTVALPNKIYTDIAGTYSFRTREDALSFAIAKEWEYRVEKLANGWSYVNIGNESVSQVYTDKTALDTAVLKYATAYVSERKEMQLGNNTYPNPTDKNGQICADALTQQNLSYPGILSAYKDLPLYLIRHDFMFSQPEVGVAGNTRKVQIKYLANDFAVAESELFELAYNQKFDTFVSENALMQGYYLVVESDLCGNVQRYVIYLDKETPTLSAVVTNGVGEKQTVEFNNEYVSQNENVMLYVSLEMQSLIDNIDEFSMICITGRKFEDKVFVVGDELPTLALENGYYGRYTINVYDRSLNYISFNVRIAGEAPYLTHTSLNNEIRCTFTVNYDTANNGISELQIFKVSYDGVYSEMLQDSDGNPISAATLSYVIRVGGKYVVRFTDIFGRVIETEPLFYMKGLPSGILKGVKEGGITNRDVSFEFSEGNNIYLYAYVDKEWVRYDEVLSLVEKEGYSIASITANADTSLIYKFFLYVENDLNLFTEYRFEVDCIAPTVSIASVDGKAIAPEEVTTSSFAVNWDESNVTARFYNTNDKLGQLGESVYQKNTIITKAGTYVFTVRDVVGNETIFTITLDNMVSFTIDGSYSMLEDGSYISKYDLVLTVTERTSQFVCTANNGMNIVNGGTISADGSYIFEISDAFGNSVRLVIIIDKLPPVPCVLTVSDKVLNMNSATNEAFKVSCDEPNVSITIKRGAQYQNYDTNEVLSEEGIYTFRMVDRMNNAVTFTITIDKSVDFKINGTYLQLDDGSYISRYFLSVTGRENFSSFSAISESGVSFALGDKIDVEGIYNVAIIDYVGNETVIKLIIDKTPPSLKVTAKDGSEVQSGKTNQSFSVSCDEQGSTIKVARTSGSSGTTYIGEMLSERGVYYFRVTDVIGNEAIYSVEIDLNVGFNVKGVYKINQSGAYVSNTSLAIELTENVNSFSVRNDNEELSIKPNEEITQENVYQVLIVDLAGNEQEITLIIDKTAPTFQIFTKSGATAEPNQIIKEGFWVNCEEEDAVIKISTNGTKFSIYDGALCTIDNTYYFEISDFVGNVVVFTVEIDLGIDYIVRGNYIRDGNRYSSRTSIIFEVKESLLNFDVQSSNGYVFAIGDTVDREGDYKIRIVDLAGNVAEVEIIIDKTPPIPTISSLDGVSILPNTATRLPFIVLSEKGATITFSTASTGKYEQYTGTVFEEEKNYSFIIRDYVGNETAFTVNLDRSVKYEIKGSYVTDKDGAIVSRYGVSVQALENFARFTVNGEVNQSVISGERITIEGEYRTFIEDMQGNTIAFIIRIDTTAPIISASIDNGGIANKEVQIEIDGAASAYYRDSAGNVINIDGSCVISNNGSYTIIAKDLVGNESSYKFSIDSVVDVRTQPLIKSGQIFTEQVSFSFNERVTTELWFNNEPIEFLSNLSDAGSYRLRAVDELGNAYEVEWIIIAPIANSYDFEIPKDYQARLIKDDNVVSISNSVKLSKDGLYTLELAKDDFTYSVEFTVDTVAPTVTITQEKNQVTFSKADKDGVVYTLYLNGEEIKCSPNSTFTERGNYRLIVTDELGNSNSYEWKLDYINTYGIVVIVIASVTVLGIVIGVLIYRRRQSVR